MYFEKFNKFGSLLLKDEFVLSYSGYASEDVLHSMGETLRQRLGDHTDDKGKIKHVFSVFVELMQNLIRYGAEGPHPTPKTGDRQAFGLIMVVQNGTTIEVMSGNYVSNNEANDLVNRVNELNDKSPEQLRELYRDDTPFQCQTSLMALVYWPKHDIAKRQNSRLTLGFL